MCAVGFGQCILHKRHQRLVLIHIVLLVNGLQFTLEQAEYGVAETLTVNQQPLLQLVGGEAVMINRDIIIGESVHAFAPHRIQNHIHLIGNGVLRGFVAQIIDMQ